MIRSPRFSTIRRVLAQCAFLGVPVTSMKTEGPSMRMTSLGIEMDTLSMTLSLHSLKLECLWREICRWENMKSCSKRELLSIIGQVQHACCVIRPGRSFLPHMIELSRCLRELHHKMRLNAGFWSNFQWWGCFLPIWIGSCFIASIVRGGIQDGTHLRCLRILGVWGFHV